jgi:hypothetical protein
MTKIVCKGTRFLLLTYKMALFGQIKSKIPCFVAKARDNKLGENKLPDNLSV